MDWKRISLNTPITQLPKFWNQSFEGVNDYIDIFYDKEEGIIQVPIRTTGKIKGTRGEFNTVVTDDLIVRNQFTNLYDNVTTIDSDYYNTYIDDPIVPRDASGDLFEGDLFENEDFSYIDVNKPYYKITNDPSIADASIAFNAESLGQQFQLMFEVESGDPFNILLDPSYNGDIKTLSIDASNAEHDKAWFILISVDIDASWGTTWALKQHSGDFEIKV